MAATRARRLWEWPTMGRMRSKRWRVGVVAARTRAPSQWVRARAPVLYRLPSLGVSARGLFVAIVSSFSFHSPCCARIVFLCHRLRLCDAFSGAAAAAAGRGSPPPPGAGVRGGVGGYGFVALCSAITMVTSKGRQGVNHYTSSSPRPPGRAFAIPLEWNGWSGGWGPGGGAWRIFDLSARGRSVACAK